MRITLLIIGLTLGSLGNLLAQKQEFEKIESKHFKRLYRINDSFYRSEQPSRKGFKELEAAGVKTIINFRRHKDDKRKVKGTDLKTKRIPLKSSELTQEQILEVLKIINEAEKPVLVHCYHGSDRTGVITAAYRVVFDDWSKEKAIEELRYEPFGYHEKWYPELVDLIMNIDKEKMQKALGIK